MLFLFAKVVFFQSSFDDISIGGKSKMILKLDGDRPSRTVWQHHNRECNIIHNIFKSLLYMFRGVAVLPSREYSFIQFIQPNALAFNPVRRNWNSEQFIALIKPKTFCECCAWECLEKNAQIRAMFVNEGSLLLSLQFRFYQSCGDTVFDWKATPCPSAPDVDVEFTYVSYSDVYCLFLSEISQTAIFNAQLPEHRHRKSVIQISLRSASWTTLSSPSIWRRWARDQISIEILLGAVNRTNKK